MIRSGIPRPTPMPMSEGVLFWDFAGEAVPPAVSLAWDERVEAASSVAVEVASLFAVDVSLVSLFWSFLLASELSYMFCNAAFQITLPFGTVKVEEQSLILQEKVDSPSHGKRPAYNSIITSSISILRK